MADRAKSLPRGSGDFNTALWADLKRTAGITTSYTQNLGRGWYTGAQVTGSVDGRQRFNASGVAVVGRKW